MEEAVGFEPTVPCGTSDFKSGALNRAQPRFHVEELTMTPHVLIIGSNPNWCAWEILRLRPIAYQAIALPLSYTRISSHPTAYRVTGILTTRAGFVSDSLARGLLPLPHSLGRVSGYNSSTQRITDQVNRYPHYWAIPAPRKAVERILFITMRKNIIVWHSAKP